MSRPFTSVHDLQTIFILTSPEEFTWTKNISFAVSKEDKDLLKTREYFLLKLQAVLVDDQCPELLSVIKSLQNTIHIASVAKIDQSYLSSLEPEKQEYSCLNVTLIIHPKILNLVKL